MRIKSSKPAIPEVDMTPMIDIVFQLIAFFMVVINFEQTQADERVKLPRDRLAKPPEVKRDNELVLNIGYLRDAVTGDKTEDRALVFYPGDPIPVLDFSPMLRLEYQVFKDTGVDPKEVTVVIRADKEVPAGVIQQLIKMSQTINPEGGFEKFALKATQAQNESQSVAP